MFKKTIAGIALSMLMLGVAYACTTTTVFGPNGEVVICTTCCDIAGNCTTTCF